MSWKETCSTISEVTRKYKELGDILKYHDASTYYPDQMYEYAKALFTRFCPFKENQLVRLTKTPLITEETAYGWLGCRHFLVEGAIARVASVDYVDGKFACQVTFETQSWINSETKKLMPKPHGSLFSFSEDYLEPIGEQK